MSTTRATTTTATTTAATTTTTAATTAGEVEKQDLMAQSFSHHETIFALSHQAKRKRPNINLTVRFFCSARRSFYWKRAICEIAQQ